MIRVVDGTHRIQQVLVVVQILLILDLVQLECLPDVLVVRQDLIRRHVHEHVVEEVGGLSVRPIRHSLGLLLLRLPDVIDHLLVLVVHLLVLFDRCLVVQHFNLRLFYCLRLPLLCGAPLVVRRFHRLLALSLVGLAVLLSLLVHVAAALIGHDLIRDEAAGPFLLDDMLARDHSFCRVRRVADLGAIGLALVWLADTVVECLLVLWRVLRLLVLAVVGLDFIRVLLSVDLVAVHQAARVAHGDGDNILLCIVILGLKAALL